MTLDPLESASPMFFAGTISAPVSGPRWLLSYWHQCGGHWCLQVTLFGAFIRSRVFQLPRRCRRVARRWRLTRVGPRFVPIEISSRCI